MDRHENQIETPPSTAAGLIGRIDRAIGKAQDWAKKGAVVGGCGALAGVVAAVSGVIARGNCVDAVVLAFFGAILLILAGVWHGAFAGGVVGAILGAFYGLGARDLSCQTIPSSEASGAPAVQQL